VVDREIFFLTFSLITVQNLVVSHTTCPHYSSSQKFWGTMGVAPLFKAKQSKDV